MAFPLNVQIFTFRIAHEIMYRIVRCKLLLARTYFFQNYRISSNSLNTEQAKTRADTTAGHLFWYACMSVGYYDMLYNVHTAPTCTDTVRIHTAVHHPRFSMRAAGTLIDNPICRHLSARRSLAATLCQSLSFVIR